MPLFGGDNKPRARCDYSGINATVSATATPGPGLTIGNVQFKVDNVNMGLADTSPYGIALDTTKLSNGPHTLTATATDSANNSVTSSPVSITVNNAAAGGTAMIAGFVPGAVRNNYSGYMGMQFTVGSTPLKITALGRMYLSGNFGSHSVKLVNASDGTDVAGGVVTVSLSGGTPGQFVYAQLPAPITFRPIPPITWQVWKPTVAISGMTAVL